MAVRKGIDDSVYHSWGMQVSRTKLALQHTREEKEDELSLSVCNGH